MEVIDLMRQVWAEVIRKDDITSQTTARPMNMQFLEMENYLKIKYVLLRAFLPKEKLLLLFFFRMDWLDLLAVQGTLSEGLLLLLLSRFSGVRLCATP